VEKLQQVPLRHALPLKQSLLVWHISPEIDLWVHIPATSVMRSGSHPLEQLAVAAALPQQNPLPVFPSMPHKPDAHISG